MSQRVLIAMAMSSGPKLLIADEPTSGLDVTIQAQFLDQMWETANRTGSAVLLVTQNLGIVANIATAWSSWSAAKCRGQRRPGLLYGARARLQAGASSPSAAAGLAHAPAAEGETAGPLVSVEGLSKDFDIRGSKDKVHAADDVSFAVHRGEAIGLVGESGSGKTTVGRCIVLLEEPTRGTVRYRDEVVSNCAAGIHAVPQRDADRLPGPDGFDEPALERRAGSDGTSGPPHRVDTGREERTRDRAARHGGDRPGGA